MELLTPQQAKQKIKDDEDRERTIKSQITTEVNKAIADFNEFRSEIVVERDKIVENHKKFKQSIQDETDALNQAIAKLEDKRDTALAPLYEKEKALIERENNVIQKENDIAAKSMAIEEIRKNLDVKANELSKKSVSLYQKEKIVNERENQLKNDEKLFDDDVSIFSLESRKRFLEIEQGLDELSKRESYLAHKESVMEIRDRLNKKKIEELNARENHIISREMALSAAIKEAKKKGVWHQ